MTVETPETGPKTQAKPTEWLLAIAALLAATATIVAAGLGAAATVSSGILNSAAAVGARHSEVVRGDRARVFSAYAGNLARFDEFLWSSVEWAGTDRDEERSAIDLERIFWEPARELQSDIASSYTEALMLDSNRAVVRALKTVEQGRADVFLRFKCMSGIQTDSCRIGNAVVGPATHAEILDLVTHWSEQSGADRDRLIQSIDIQLN